MGDTPGEDDNEAMRNMNCRYVLRDFGDCYRLYRVWAFIELCYLHRTDAPLAYIIAVLAHVPIGFLIFLGIHFYKFSRSHIQRAACVN